MTVSTPARQNSSVKKRLYLSNATMPLKPVSTSTLRTTSAPLAKRHTAQPPVQVSHWPAATPAVTARPPAATQASTDLVRENASTNSTTTAVAAIMIPGSSSMTSLFI